MLNPIDEVLVAEPVMFKRAAWRKPANDEVAAASVMLRAPAARREPVAFTKVRFWRVVEERAVKLLVVSVPAVTLVVDAVSAVRLVAANDDEVARVVVRSVAVRFVKIPVTPRMIEAKNEVVVACDPVAFTKVMFWKVDEASERMPPVAVVRPVIPRVEPTVAAPVIDAEPRVADPSTAKVPVAVMLVVVRVVAMVEEETVRVPAERLFPPMLMLPKPRPIEPLVSVPTVVRLASVVRFGSVVVAASRASKRVFVQ